MFLIFLVDFVLKINGNLYLFVLSWIEIKQKTRHYQGDNSFIFINCIKKLKKEKQWTCRWEKLIEAV